MWFEEDILFYSRFLRVLQSLTRPAARRSYQLSRSAQTLPGSRAAVEGSKLLLHSDRAIMERYKVLTDTCTRTIVTSDVTIYQFMNRIWEDEAESRRQSIPPPIPLHSQLHLPSDLFPISLPSPKTPDLHAPHSRGPPQS
ncbi:hypothetical protein BDP27DRAFT_648352 [Rhodocollybia butyracea]|uniref:Uncharacterized protein n=1 Tax=Rhodocollybia butyracea TaxID=206335 RepID=A0A9P5U7Q3_9AGAR|nr:hypothetical protein BDP27DRAFT_648352 [Rhodocollybia butyracea]